MFSDKKLAESDFPVRSQFPSLFLTVIQIFVFKFIFDYRDGKSEHRLRHSLHMKLLGSFSEEKCFNLLSIFFYLGEAVLIFRSHFALIYVVFGYC